MLVCHYNKPLLYHFDSPAAWLITLRNAGPCKFGIMFCSVRLCVSPKSSLFNCVVPTIGRACNRAMRVLKKQTNILLVKYWMMSLGGIYQSANICRNLARAHQTLTISQLSLVLERNKREDDIDWSKLANASPKPKRLYLEEEDCVACFTVQFKPAIMMLTQRLQKTRKEQTPLVLSFGRKAKQHLD